MPTITLYRAADDDYLDEGCSFAEKKSTARAYLHNPGYGGGRVYRAKVRYEPEAVADLRGKSADEIAEELSLSPPGAIGADEYVTHSGSVELRRRLVHQGFQWALVDESFPPGTVTWVWLGEGEEPELVRVE